MLRARLLLSTLAPAAAFLLSCSSKDLSEFNAGSAGGSGGAAAGSGGSAGSAGSSGASGGSAGSASGGSAGSASGGSAGSASGGSGGSAGSGGNGSGGSSANLCEDLCNKSANLACPNENQANCRTDCEAQYAVCKTEFDALVGCIETSGSLSCGSNGKLQIDGCNTLLIPALVCAACTPSVSAPSCDVCAAKQCCAESKAFVGHSNSTKLTGCTEACPAGDATCIQGCLTQYPEAGALAGALYQCRVSECGSSCG